MQLQINPKNKQRNKQNKTKTIKTNKQYRDRDGIRTQGLCVGAAELYRLNYENTLGLGQFDEFILTRETYLIDLTSLHIPSWPWNRDK